MSERFIRRYFFDSILVLIIIILLAVIIAPKFKRAQSTTRIDFSAAQGYAEGNLHGQPQDAGKVWTAGAPSEPADAYILNEALYLIADANGGKGHHHGRWVLFPLPAWKSGDLTVLWDWRYIGSANWGFDCGLALADSGNFGLDGNPNITWNELCTMVHMQPHGKRIEAINGNGTGGQTYVAMEELIFGFGNKISMRMYIDIDTQTYDLYAKEEGQPEIMLASKCGFRRATNGGLDTLAIWENALLGGACVWFDNIMVTAGQRDFANQPGRYKAHGHKPLAIAAGDWPNTNTAILGYGFVNPHVGLVGDNEKFQVIKPEADIVRLIFKTFLKTESLETTAGELNRDGITTKAWNELKGYELGAEPYDAPRVEAVLRNPSYLGLGHRNGQPLIERETFEQANQLLDKLYEIPEKTL